MSALISLLEGGLRLCMEGPVEIVAIEELSLNEARTHAISRLHLTLASGRELDVIFKRLRPQPGKDTGREVLTYRRLLTDGRLGAPRLYASACDEAHDRYWLLLEDVGTRRLDQCGLAGQVEAVRWTARMHATYHNRQAALRSLCCLGEHGTPFYGVLAAAGRSRLAKLGTPEALQRFDRLMGPFQTTIRFLDNQPHTLVHGDLSDHNILVQSGDSLQIRPIDWEWAAIGVGAWDLDKLLAGGGAAKHQLKAVYRYEFARQAGTPLDPYTLESALRHCKILRMLWNLGCPSPPPSGITWDTTGIDRLLDTITILQTEATDD